MNPIEQVKFMLISIAKEIGWAIYGFVAMTAILWLIVAVVWIGWTLSNLARF